MKDGVPHTMRAVRLAAYGHEIGLEVTHVPVPTPGPGQVLVRVAASPIHLDDIVFCRGRHGVRRALPTTPGFEASGRVVAVGGGLVTRFLADRRVAMAIREDQDGTWAEYALAEASRCLPLWDGIDDRAASCLLVDPVTAMAMLDEVKNHGHKGVIQTHPRGPVGRILVRLSKAWSMPMVHVAADADEAEAVRRDGADVVLDASAPDFDAQLRRATRAWEATAVLDAVGGDLIGRILAAMPDGAEAMVYGLEPGTTVTVDLAEFVYHRKTVRGFSFLERASAQGTRSLLAQLPRLRRYADAAFRPVLDRAITLDEVPDVMASYTRDRGGGRILVVPGPAPRHGDD